MEGPGNLSKLTCPSQSTYVFRIFAAADALQQVLIGTDTLQIIACCKKILEVYYQMYKSGLHSVFARHKHVRLLLNLLQLYLNLYPYICACCFCKLTYTECLPQAARILKAERVFCTGSVFLTVLKASLLPMNHHSCTLNQL